MTTRTVIAAARGRPAPALAALYRHVPAQLLILLGAARGLVRGGLPRLAGDPAAERVLVPRIRCTSAVVHELQPEQLPAADRATRQPGDHRCARSRSPWRSPPRTCSWPSRSPGSWPGSRRRAVRSLLFMGVLLPLWSNYLVRVFAWRIILAKGGPLDGLLGLAGLPGPGFSERLDLARVQLPLAAVHDPADLRRLRADPRLALRGVGRPRRARRGPRSGGWSCRSSCRRSPPARSSRSR